MRKVGRVLTFAAATVSGALLCTASPASAQYEFGNWCLAVGPGPTVGLPECTYVAPDDTQTVLAVTPNEWEISVIRECPRFQLACPLTQALYECPEPQNPDNPNCEPLRNEANEILTSPTQVFLLQGGGVGGWTIPRTVHPEPGETVYVRMDVPPSGGYGFIAVGFDEDYAELPWGDLPAAIDEVPSVGLGR